MNERATSAAFALLVLTILGRSITAQSVLLEGGSSSLFHADGGTVEIRGPGSSVSISAGQLQGQLIVGALLKKPTRAGTLRLGDGILDFSLPTDIFDGTRQISIRGAGLDTTVGQFHVAGMIGGTSTTRGAPFFRGARWDAALGSLFIDRPLGAKGHLFSRNAFSSRQTSIHGVDWRATDTLTLATAAGIGTNEPYVAASATWETAWLSARTTYVRPHEDFGRVTAESPMTAEHEAENLSFALRPHRWWSLNGARQHFVNTPKDGAAERVMVNQVGASLNAAGFRSGTTLFVSRGGRFGHRGASFNLARRVTDAVEVVVDHFRGVSEGGRTSSTVATLRETINPRLSLLQLVSSAGGRPSLSMGGEFLSNPLTVSVSYQTVYAPFRIGRPFVQALGVDLRLRLTGNLQLHLATFTSPDGTLRYTVSGSQWLSRSGADGGGTAPGGFRFPKYIVRGRVTDQSGRPVDGAAVRVGSEDLTTDRAGRFSVRVNKAGVLDLAVLTEHFTAPGLFAVVAAPARAMPALDGSSSEIDIVVRRY